MKCEVCGYKVTRNDSICPNCGFQLKKEIQIEATAYDDINDNLIKNKKMDFIESLELRAFKSRAKVVRFDKMFVVFIVIMLLIIISNIIG